MRNKKQHRKVGLIVNCHTPRDQHWCSCKFKLTRTMLIRMLCTLIEALECRCDKPTAIQELWLIRGETTDPLAEAIEERKRNPQRWTGHIDEHDTWGLSELRKDQY